MATLKIEKVTGEPSFLKPNTLYLSASSSDSVDLTVIVTDTLGNQTRRTVNRHDLSQAVATLVKRSDQTAKTGTMTQQVGIDANGVLWVPPSASSNERVDNYFLPNNGDSVEMRLGAQVVLIFSNIDTNSPGQFSFRLRSFSQNTTVSWSRSLSRQQYASMTFSNSTVLTPSNPFTIDTTLPGEMNSFTRFTIADQSTLEAWTVNFFFFASGRLKAKVSPY